MLFKACVTTSGCLLWTQNGVLSLPILFFGIKRSHRAWDCQSSMGSNKFSYSCCVVTCPCCWWSSAALLIFNNGSAFRKHFMPAKGLCSWHCIISKGLLKFFMCCGGTVTEFNTKKDGIPLHDVPCFHFRDEVRKHVFTRQAPTPQWITAKPCHCKWG